MEKTEIVKGIVGFLVGTSVGAVAKNAIKSTTPIITDTRIKILVTIGEFVLSSMAAKAASKYTDKEIDNIVEDFQKFTKKEEPKSEE